MWRVVSSAMDVEKWSITLNGVVVNGLRWRELGYLAEGIGLDRITHNFTLELVDVDGSHKAIDDAVRVSDQEAVDMTHWLLENEGLFVGSSSAMNIVGAVRIAMGGSVGN